MTPLLLIFSLAAPGLRFEWARGPGAEACPDRDTLAERAARLGAKFEAGSQASIEGWATCEEGCIARLHFFDGEGRPSGDRRLEAPDCEALSQSILLALSLAPRPAAPPPARTVITPVAAPVEAPEPAPPPKHPSAEARALLQSGLLPGGWSPGVDIGIRSPRWTGFRVGLGLRHLLFRRERAIGLSLAAGWLDVCGGGVWGRWMLEACARAFYGATTVSVQSDERIQALGPGHYDWGQLAAGLRVGFALFGPLALVGEAELGLPLMRRELQILDRPELRFREASWVPSFGLGLAVGWP